MSQNTNVIKLVVSGDVGSGKTAFVKAISEIDPITTDEVASDEVKNLKETTTVAMDFGTLTVDEDLILHLYATPGQKRFDFMWDVLAEGSFGVIFLADATRKESIEKTSHIVDYFNKNMSDIPYIIGVTKMDIEGSFSLEEVMDIIGKTETQYIPLNADNKEDVRSTLITLISMAMSD